MRPRAAAWPRPWRRLASARKLQKAPFWGPKEIVNSSSMPPIKTVGLIAKPGSPAATTLVPDLLKWLAAHELHARCDEQTATYAGRTGGIPREEVPDGTQLVI